MGDNADASSAAQGAQDTSEGTAPGPFGFFQRLVGGSTPAPAPGPETFGTPADMAAASRGAQTMLLNIERMRGVRIHDVAVPRADITAVPDTTTQDELVQVFRESGYSRLPIYSETIDNPLGFVHLKDLSLRYGFDCTDTRFDIADVTRDLLYAPPSMSMGVLLQKMQSDRIHMALVIDEYGGVEGLVTIEDLVEQIVGEIADEHDVEEADLWIEEKPDVYLVQARAALTEFEEAIGFSLRPDDPDEDIDSLGGLVFQLAGRVPLRGEVIPDAYGNEYEVVEADPRRLKRIRVQIGNRVALDKAAE